jgi:DNA repair exonuclease SbcCD ATPase subunit
MSDIDELQRRITAAMDRVAAGLESLSQGDAGETDTLRQALDEEKTVNAQLTERVRVLGERQAKALDKLEARAQEAETRMGKLDTDLQRLRRANAQLSEACEALRTANAEGVGEAHLINKAMMAELEALRAARTAEIAQADTLLATLGPLVEAAIPPAKEEAS